jgi:hypothetical protein
MLVAGAESSPLQALGSLGEALAGLAAIVGVPYAIRRVRESRAYQYADQLQGKDLLPIVAEAREFWRYGRKVSETEAMRWWAAMTDEKRHRIVLPMNLLEQVGQMYMDGFIARGLVEKYLGTTATAFYQEAEWFIDEIRARRKRRGLSGIPWEQWELMLNHFGPKPWHRGDLFPGSWTTPPEA